MTAETLKPFITPTSAASYVTTESSAAAAESRHRRSCYFLAITASAITVILTAALLGITIWNTMRIANLQTEVQSLNRVIDSMQKRLGLTYLDDLSDLEKDEENINSLIDDELPDANDNDDDDNNLENISGEEDDDDDEYEDYEYPVHKFHHYQKAEDDEQEEETDNAADNVGDDNLYDDFEKYNDSKKKHLGERKTRSVTALNGDNDNFEEESTNERQRSFSDNYLKSIVSNDNYERRRSHLRLHGSRRRKYPLVKSGDSLISAKTVAPLTSYNNEVKPAAHFHISERVSYHKHNMQMNNHNGDVYIGQPSLTNEMDVNNYFHVEHGVITIRESGLYYVYAQICYNNTFTKNGFTIFHGDKEFLQCLHNSHTNNVSLINTCHTSGLIYLQKDDKIHIRDFHANRQSYLSAKSVRSYFGLIKI